MLRKLSGNDDVRYRMQRNKILLPGKSTVGRHVIERLADPIEDGIHVRSFLFRDR